MNAMPFVPTSGAETNISHAFALLTPTFINVETRVLSLSDKHGMATLLWSFSVCASLFIEFLN